MPLRPLCRRSAARPRAGFSILELVIVVAIVLVLTALGIGLSSDLVPRYRTMKAAKQFASYVNQCRATAIQTNRECSIWMLDQDSALTSLTSNAGTYWVSVGNLSTNSTTWDLLPMDSQADTTDDDTSQGIVDLADEQGAFYARHVSISGWGTLSGPGSGNTDRIVFDPRGFVANPNGDFTSSGMIEVTFVNKLARSKGVDESFIVQISRSGMTRIDSSVRNEFDALTAGVPRSSS
jgi:prepilin-type N-terminal cleavage/methylation domain-containing protein